MSKSYKYQYLGHTIHIPRDVVDIIKADERAKVIDEFARELHKILNLDGVCFSKTIDKIAEQLKEQSNDSKPNN